MSKKAQVVIADDQPVYLIGLKHLIDQIGEFDLVGSASDGVQALEMIRDKRPELALIDIELPGLTGIEISESIRNESIPTRVIALTMLKDENMFNQALEAGVHGYLLKENSINDLTESLRTVSKGNFFFSSSVSNFLVNRTSKVPGPERKGRKLTKTERLVMKFIAEGSTSNEIAKKMKISVKTINNHRANICKKLNLKGTNSLLVFAMKNKEAYIHG